ncbi:MAG: diaminopimelate decarboxylase [Lachnospiraceae bacterium]|nr:diaminopimelate decarboxylase [Lachnospiraceae bacterium]
MICNNLSVNDNNHLTLAGVDVVSMAKKYGTPLMLMDEGKIREKCSIYRDAMKKYFTEDSMPLFASKALSFKYIYKIANSENIGIDCVSAGEIYTAVQAGFPMEKAYFHGNSKTEEEIKFAIESGVGHFVCDSIEEVSVVDEIAGQMGVKQKLLLRITPGIDPHTHKKISTGSVDSKFGVAIETKQAYTLVEKTLKLANVELCGYHCHIGSQIFEYDPFCDAARIMIKFIADTKEMFGYAASELNLGGGMGVRYTEEDPEIDYAANIKGIADIVKELCAEYSVDMPKILMEPGRSIVADAGLTLYTAGYLKEITGLKNYISIDGGMTDNPRFTLYQSPYTVLLANRMNEEKNYKCTVAGRCCESGDIIQEDVMMPKPNRNDTIAVLTTGAYNYAMASHYNKVPKPAVVMLKDGEDFVVIKRETLADMIANEV